MSATTQQAAPATSTAAPVVETPQAPVAPPPEPKILEVKTEAAAQPAPKIDETPAPLEVPEKYELKMPDGTKLEGAYLDQVVSYAKENKLTNDQAQKLLDRDSGLVHKYNDSLVNQYQQQVNSWRDAVMKDKEIGGDNFNASKELAFRAVDHFGGAELRQALVDSGYEFHPTVLKAFVKIGKAMAEDKIHVPGTQPGAQIKSHAGRLYDHPTSTKK